MRLTVRGPAEVDQISSGGGIQRRAELDHPGALRGGGVLNAQRGFGIVVLDGPNGLRDLQHGIRRGAEQQVELLVHLVQVVVQHRHGDPLRQLTGSELDGSRDALEVLSFPGVRVRGPVIHGYHAATACRQPNQEDQFTVALCRAAVRGQECRGGVIVLDRPFGLTFDHTRVSDIRHREHQGFVIFIQAVVQNLHLDYAMLPAGTDSE